MIFFLMFICLFFMLIQASASTQRGPIRRNTRDPLIGKSVKIIGGNFKGYVGAVVDITGTCSM